METINMRKNRIFSLVFTSCCLLITTSTMANNADKPKLNIDMIPIGSISVKNVRAITFNPRGDLLAAITEDKQLRVYNRSGAIKTVLSLPNGSSLTLTSQALAFSWDGKYLASCFNPIEGTGVIRVWETKNWGIVADIKGAKPGTACRAIAFSKDSATLFSIMHRQLILGGPSITSYDTADWQEKRTFNTGPLRAHVLRPSSDSGYVAIAGKVRNPIHWNSPGNPPTFGNPPVEDSAVIALVDMNQSKIVQIIKDVSTVADFSDIVWGDARGPIFSAGNLGVDMLDFNDPSRASLAQSKGIDVHTSLITDKSLDILVEGVDSKDVNYLRIWNTKSKSVEYSADRKVRALAISSDDGVLAVANEDSIEIFNVKR